MYCSDDQNAGYCGMVLTTCRGMPAQTASPSGQGLRSGRPALQPLRLPDEGACGDHRSTHPHSTVQCLARRGGNAALSPQLCGTFAHLGADIVERQWLGWRVKVPRGRQMAIRPCASAVLSWKTPSLRGGRIGPPTIWKGAAMHRVMRVARFIFRTWQVGAYSHSGTISSTSGR